MATPVQLALPALLEAAEEIQPRIRARLRANLGTIDVAVAGTVVDRLHAAAGWTAVLRLPALDRLDDHGWALRLLDAGVLVQPGYLFDLAGPPRVAISLLTPEATMAEGMGRMLASVSSGL